MVDVMIAVTVCSNRQILTAVNYQKFFAPQLLR